MNPSIVDQLDREYAPAWKPAKNDKLVGALVALDVYDAGYGPYKILTVRQENGEELAWRAYHDVAKGKVDEAEAAGRLKLGVEIGIKYRGLIPNRSGSGKYHDYALIVARDYDTAAEFEKPQAGGAGARPEDNDDSPPF